MKQRDCDRLKEILEVSHEIIEVIEGRKRADIEKDIMFKRTLERCIEIIGEAANNLPDDFKKCHSDIPWDKMIGMRNRLSHAYMEVDYDIVWNTAKNKIPDLIQNINKLVSE